MKFHNMRANLFPTININWRVRLRRTFGITHVSAPAMRYANSHDGPPLATPAAIVRSLLLTLAVGGTAYGGANAARAAQSPGAGPALHPAESRSGEVPSSGARILVRVTSVSAGPTVCGVVARAVPSAGNGRRPASRFFVWRNGQVLWQGKCPGPIGWLAVARPANRIVFATEKSIRVLALRGGKQLLRFRPPWAFSYLPPIQLGPEGRFAAVLLVATPRRGSAYLEFDRDTPVGVELCDLSTGLTGRVLFHGSPPQIGFAGGLLVACPSPGASHRPQVSAFAFAARKGSLRLVRRWQKKVSKGGYIAALAGGTPVVVRASGKSISVGRRTIRPPGGFHGIGEVVGARRGILVIQGNGQFGVAVAPAWKYQPVGRVGLGQLVGAGRNGEEFWVAQPGLKITLINRKGKSRTLIVPAPRLADN